MRRSQLKQLFHHQTILITLVLRLITNDGFSSDSSIAGSALFRVAWVHLGYIAGDRRQNLNSKLAQVPEQSEFTYSAYFVAAGHLEPGGGRAAG